MVIPFLEDPVPFDFAIPGVTSIAVDPHKMGMSTIPCGCLLTRDPGILNTLNIDTPYLTVKQEYTLGGTRPGHRSPGRSPCSTISAGRGWRPWWPGA